MTDDAVPSADNAAELLTAMRDLIRRVRVAQRGTWFPLLVLAVITLAAIPVYRYAPHHVGRCATRPGGTSLCTAVIPAVLVYWPVALMLGYAVIAAFSVRRFRQRGVGTPIRSYVVVGAVLAVLLAAAAVWRAVHPRTPSVGAPPAHEFLYGLATPAAAIGLALLVLAWAERSPALLGYSLAYLVVVLAQSNQAIHSSSPWYFLPALLLPAALLLLGSAGFALHQRATERPAR